MEEQQTPSTKLVQELTLAQWLVHKLKYTYKTTNVEAPTTGSLWRKNLRLLLLSEKIFAFSKGFYCEKPKLKCFVDPASKNKRPDKGSHSVASDVESHRKRHRTASMTQPLWPSEGVSEGASKGARERVLCLSYL